MKLTRCPNKHFYDCHKNAVCPYCEAKAAKNQQAVQSPIPAQPAPVNNYVHTQYIGEEEQITAASAPNQWGDKTVWMNEEEALAALPQQPAIPSQSAPSAQSAIPQQPVLPAQPAPSEQAAVPVQSLASEQSVASEQSAIPQQPVIPQQPAQQNGLTDLQKQVAASRNSVNSTTTQAGSKTVAFYDVGDSDPVVGWLICVQGEYVGESFNLKAGQNFIGRSLSMDVALVNEKSVSREFHAGIIFEPNEGKFFGIPGQSNGLTYVNDELLIAPKTLEAYDRIKLGKSLYVFMPFCGEKFNWDTYLSDKNVTIMR